MRISLSTMHRGHEATNLSATRRSRSIGLLNTIHLLLLFEPPDGERMAHMCFQEEGHLQWPGGEVAEPEKPLSETLTLRLVRKDECKEACQPRIGPSLRYPYGLICNEDLHYIEMIEEDGEAWTPPDEVLQSRESVERRDRRCLFSDKESYADETGWTYFVAPPEGVAERADDALIQSGPLPAHLQGTINRPSSGMLVNFDRS